MSKESSPAAEQPAPSFQDQVRDRFLELVAKDERISEHTSTVLTKLFHLSSIPNRATIVKVVSRET